MKDKAHRAKLFRALHAEAAKRNIDHDALRDIFRQRHGCKSMSDATTPQLDSLLRGWTGKSVKRTTRLSNTKGMIAEGKPLQVISAEDMGTLAEAFHRAGWGEDTRRQFIRRQLGRDAIRTVQDFHRVFSGIRAINRREEAKSNQTTTKENQ